MSLNWRKYAQKMTDFTDKICRLDAENEVYRQVVEGIIKHGEYKGDVMKAFDTFTRESASRLMSWREFELLLSSMSMKTKDPINRPIYKAMFAKAITEGDSISSYQIDRHGFAHCFAKQALR
jgi:hypothetical protein